jgi:hypothetical protein
MEDALLTPPYGSVNAPAGNYLKIAGEDAHSRKFVSKVLAGVATHDHILLFFVGMAKYMLDTDISCFNDSTRHILDHT